METADDKNQILKSSTAEKPGDSATQPDADTSVNGTQRKISARKLAANLRNGAKGGVKTQEGKDRSRWNSWVHGMEANTLLAVNDGSDTYREFREVLNVLAAEFELRTMEDYIELERAAIAIQRQRNGYKFEHAEMADSAAFHHPAMDRLLRYGTAADRQLSKALAKLRSKKSDNKEPNAG